MKKIFKIILMIFIIFSLSFYGCGWRREDNKKIDDHSVKQIKGINTKNDGKNYDKSDEINDVKNDDKSEQPNDKDVEIKKEPELDLEKVKPDESGKIMVVMFHSFVETFTPGKYDKGEFTITFKAFEELLDNLYNKGYRLISFKDFLDNSVSVSSGCIPMVFTFDDATSGQFNMIEENGELKANKSSAVGIMLEFNKKHPDFGMKGTFFVNLGSNIFNGKGNAAERLKYLIDLGFEIGNHTFSHINLKNTKSKDIIQQELGKNQKVIYELIPGYKMFAFSLPYGAPSDDLMEYVKKGEYEGIKYENLGIVEVGWNPSLSTINKQFNWASINRVRAPGINPEKFDLNWWLENISAKEEYISDGNANKVTIPKEKIDSIDLEKLNDRELITY